MGGRGDCQGWGGKQHVKAIPTAVNYIVCELSSTWGGGTRGPRHLVAGPMSRLVNLYLVSGDLVLGGMKGTTLCTGGKCVVY